MSMSIGAPKNDHQEASAVSRRTLVKGAAWAVPVIAFAGPAPAFAASPCTPSTNLDGLQTGSKPSAIAFQPSGLVATLSYASAGQPNAPTPGGTGTVAQTSTNPSWKYIELEMVQNLDQGDYVQLTVTFPQAVENLRFTVHDIDKVRNNQGDVAWVDHVVITGTTGYSAVKGTNVIGSGSNGDPFRADQWGDNPIDSGLNRVTVTFPGLVTQVTIRYVAGANGYSGNQHVGLGNLSYSVCNPAGSGAQSRSFSAEPLELPAETEGFANPSDVAAPGEVAVDN
jgi:hypothetical protein